MTNFDSTVDRPVSDGPARWSIAGRFLECLTSRDYERLATTLDEEVRFRALLPPGSSQWVGRDETADVFRSWFGTADRFEVVDATVGEIGGRLQMTWRLRLRPAPFDIGTSWHVIEQHAFLDVADTISTIDLVCSGFRAESTHDTPTGGTR